MHEDHNKAGDRSGLLLAFWLNLSFSVIELVGGILTNSTAIIADAFHDFMDAVAIGVAVLMEKFSRKKRSKSYSYGYRRFSLLSAVLLSTILLVGSVLMAIMGVKSMLDARPVYSQGMLILAVIGIAVNGFAMLRLRKGSSDSHSHSHSHIHEHVHSTGENHNTRAVMLHLMEDVLGWIAVLIGAAVIYFTGWYWIDGLIAVGIAIFIFYNASRNLLSTMQILLQSVPSSVDLASWKSNISEIEAVCDVHDLHAWTMDGRYTIGTIHVVIKEECRPIQNEILRQIQNISQSAGIDHVTIQLEDKFSPCTTQDC